MKAYTIILIIILFLTIFSSIAFASRPNPARFYFRIEEDGGPSGDGKKWDNYSAIEQVGGVMFFNYSFLNMNFHYF